MKILKRDNGDIEATITFDITDHGHELGAKRNYDIDVLTNLIRNPITQHHINIGACLGYLGHSGRNYKNNPHIAKELNTKGEKVEPALRTLALSIDGTLITHTQLIINTEIGRKIMKFADSGFGGFSFAWNDNIFAGVDYVYTPNFAGNKIIEGAICNGVCDPTNIANRLTLDEVGSESPDILDFILDSAEMIRIQNIRDAVNKELGLKLDSVLEINRGLLEETLMYQSEMKQMQNLLIENGFSYDGTNILLNKDSVAGLMRVANLNENLDYLLNDLEQMKPQVNKRPGLNQRYW